MSTPFNTDAGTLMDRPCTRPISGVSGVSCVIAAETITIRTRLRAIGMQPLVLVAVASISVLGSIDVGSYRTPTESLGAGADFESCDPGTPPGIGSGSNAAGGGGAGGSFMGAGGNGGQAGDGTGGQRGRVLGLGTIHGGCSGQDGAGGSRGVAGHGGGAVFLVARENITLGDSIMAGGEGGAEAARFAGAGGGGAGGMIGLDAHAITVEPTTVNLVANGGGGGGAGSNTGRGEPGEDATSTSAARGGSGAAGGNGGSGSAGAAGGPGAVGMNGIAGGGGGGGGGAGLILVRASMGASLAGANASPVPTPSPQ
jgi:hypothetical protein